MKTETPTAPFEVISESEGQSYVNIFRDGKVWLGSVERTIALEIVRKMNALYKINDIRNSIIGYHSINWSAHIYPLVAALNDAGIEGMGYDQARLMWQRINFKESVIWRNPIKELLEALQECTSTLKRTLKSAYCQVDDDGTVEEMEAMIEKHTPPVGVETK